MILLHDKFLPVVIIVWLNAIGLFKARLPSNFFPIRSDMRKCLAKLIISLTNVIFFDITDLLFQNGCSPHTSKKKYVLSQQKMMIGDRVLNQKDQSIQELHLLTNLNKPFIDLRPQGRAGLSCKTLIQAMYRWKTAKRKYAIH